MTTQRDDLEAVVAEIYAGPLGDTDEHAARLILAARKERDAARAEYLRMDGEYQKRCDERDAARQEAEDCHAKWRDEAEKRQEALAALDEAQRQGAENARLREAFEEHQRDAINHGEWQALYDACWNALAPKEGV